MASIFRNLDPSIVVRDPFPHLCVDRLLDDDLCRQLTVEILPPEKYAGGRVFGDDEKLFAPGKLMLRDPEMSSNWKRIIADNVTPDAFRDFYRLFKEDIAREFPRVADRLEKIDSLHIRQRGTGPKGAFDVQIEAQLVYFMPVKGAQAAERGPHLKTTSKIYNSFFCLRTDDDRSTGGDLVLHKLRPGASVGRRNQVDPSYVSPAGTFPRRQNIYVGFLNTRRSVTEMTPRSTSPLPAVYMNLAIELSPRIWASGRFPFLGWSWRRW